MRDGFLVCQGCQRYYLHKGKEEPHRAVLHRSIISKVLFLVAVDRPQRATSRNVFNGKLRCWPIVKQVKTRRSSLNRPAGRLETKSYSVTKESYENLFLNSVTPAEKGTFPRHTSQKIIIQHDNASHHNFDDDNEFLATCNEACTQKIVFQIANSPYFNVLYPGLISCVFRFSESKKC